MSVSVSVCQCVSVSEWASEYARVKSASENVSRECERAKRGRVEGMRQWLLISKLLWCCWKKLWIGECMLCICTYTAHTLAHSQTHILPHTLTHTHHIHSHTHLLLISKPCLSHTSSLTHTLTLCLTYSHSHSPLHSYYTLSHTYSHTLSQTQDFPK